MRVTLWNSKKANQRQGILMSSAHLILNIPDRRVKWVEFILTGGNGDGGLVAAKDDWCEDSSVRGWILRNLILCRSSEGWLFELGKNDIPLASMPKSPTSSLSTAASPS